MTKSRERDRAEQLYNDGHALFQKGLYREALQELQVAADAFRSLDARGSPFSRPLANGVSGLAASLALAGLCRQKLGDFRSALEHYETSFINEKFERKYPFRRFKQKLAEDMRSCYEKMCESVPREERQNLLQREHQMDPSFRFPFSLPPDVIPFARLYELFPGDFAHYADFYNRARRRDRECRLRSRSSDESVKKRMSVYVWSILLMIWAVYGIIMLDALVRSDR